MNQKILIFIVVLVAAASFLAGSFWGRSQSLEKQLGTQGGQTTPTPVAQAQPTPTVLGEEALSKIYQSGWAKGNKEAKVTIVEFSDFECPYCGRYATETFPQIDKGYIQTGKVRYVFHHYPLPFHQSAQKAAEATECAGEQGKFWEAHDKLFGNQQALSVANLKSYASSLGLRTADFNACLDSGKFEAKVKADLALGTEIGVRGTPAFFINGKLVSGAQPFANFKQIIEEELGK